MSFLSVILPTLNCAETIPAHIQAMESWLDLVDEIIAVDSDSEDGTPDIIRKSIRHPKLRQLNHPRGLYQSWNYAISESTGKWIYLSTIGDSITREQLEHLILAGEALKADVVASPPKFVFDAQVTMDAPVWPVQHIVEFYSVHQPFVISPLAAFVHAAYFSPDAILGSSASNIYRGEHLRKRLFPTEFQMAGDTGWAIRYALETRFCYTAKVGSVFRFHSETYTSLDPQLNQRMIHALHEECVKGVSENRMSANEALMDLLGEVLELKLIYKEANADWRLTKRSGIMPWFLRPAAIQSHQKRRAYKAELSEKTRNLETALKLLPLEVLS